MLSGLSSLVLGKGLKSRAGLCARPPPGHFCHPFFIYKQTIFDCEPSFFCGRGFASTPLLVGARLRKTNAKNRETTLGGGSLGSCVDEERSQLRELM